MTGVDGGALAGLLVASVTEGLPGGSAGPTALGPAVTALELAEVVRAADFHRVLPALATHVLRAPDAPEGWSAELRGVRMDQRLRHLAVMADLARLTAAMDGAGLNWSVVKGPVVAATLWPAVDLREYYDLDVLVDPARLELVLAVLSELGAAQLDVAWRMIRRQRRAELSFVLPGGTLLDLHWHLVNDWPTRRGLRWDSAGLLERARRVDLGPFAVPALDAADTALHLGYHMVHSGGHRLLWMRDVAAGVLADDLDVDELWRRADLTGLAPFLHLALARVGRVFPAVEPARGGRPDPWTAVVIRADRRHPAVATGHGREHRAMYASTRATVAGSLAGLGSTMTARLARAVGLRQHSRDVVLNPLHVPDHDERARRDFLAMVRSQ